MASLVGSLAVFLFVMFYYRVSGVIAVISLIVGGIGVNALGQGNRANATIGRALRLHRWSPVRSLTARRLPSGSTG